MSNPTTSAAEALRLRWEQYRSENPRVRIRDAAAALGVSEAQLLATDVGGRVIRLRPEWGPILADLEAVGRVTCLTRNEHCVHEKTGMWRNVEVSPAHVLVLDEAIDLRLFPRAWASGFAVESPAPWGGTRPSVQFFDRTGTAVLKVFADREADVDAFAALIGKYRSDDTSPEQAVEVRAPEAAERPDAEIDATGLRAAWRGLQDTHDFFLLLRRFGVGRTQALRLADPDMAWAAPAGAFRAALAEAAQAALPIMIFVGNPGAIQIHTGPVARIEDVGPWFNVLDPTFNLHLREDAIAGSWLVRKPTTDGVVTSLELYDAAGQAILQMFGRRKPGSPELLEWRALIERHAPASAATA